MHNYYFAVAVLVRFANVTVYFEVSRSRGYSGFYAAHRVFVVRFGQGAVRGVKRHAAHSAAAVAFENVVNRVEIFGHNAVSSASHAVVYVHGGVVSGAYPNGFETRLNVANVIHACRALRNYRNVRKRRIGSAYNAVEFVLRVLTKRIFGIFHNTAHFGVLLAHVFYQIGVFAHNG